MTQQPYNVIWTEDGWVIKPLGYHGDKYMFPPYKNIGKAKEELARFINEPVTLYTHGKCGRVTKKEVLEPYVCYKLSAKQMEMIENCDIKLLGGAVDEQS